MAAEEDNFDIDIYGEGTGDDYDQHEGNAQDQSGQEASTSADHSVQQDHSYANEGEQQHYDHSSSHAQNNHQTVQAQGTKRKEGADDRPLDPGATAALFVTDLPWWINDDDIRGWANQSRSEDELEDVTFSEHKVNGKSKGQAYVLFSTPQAATATKHYLESLGEGSKYKQKFASNYTNPLMNPFKTLPKDGNTRGPAQGARSTSTGFNSSGGQGQSNVGQGGFRGGRGGYNNRGGMGGYNRGGFNQPAPGSFQGGGMNNFQGGMQNYGGFNSRGGMMGGMRGGNMGMRGGGRGGMNNMMGMPMGGMMGMPGLGANMGMQGMTGQFRDARSFPFAVGYTPRHYGAEQICSAPLLPHLKHHKVGYVGDNLHPGGWISKREAKYLGHASTYQSPHNSNSYGAVKQDFRGKHEHDNQMLSQSSVTGSGFQAPTFFQQGGDNWNPHGAKRTRQE